MKSKFNLGDIVRLPSGAKGQVDMIQVGYNKLIPLDLYGKVSNRTTLGVNAQGRNILIADYQCEFLSKMPESC
ncbi:hypothetical protein [Lactiplantibacillus paraxiangfangensis]|uniref:hypothetical protein n=1 Tax=Lactiplantibacillus paraxiangfangensis TaxID=3076224 RepID=UPI0030C6CA6A